MFKPGGRFQEEPKVADIFSLKGKVALVTGASSGIGKRFAQTLLRAGAQVVLASRNKETLAAVCADLGSQASTLPLDISKPSSVYRAVAALAQRHKSVDILVNAAGNLAMTPIFESTVADFRSLILTNVVGTWALTQAIAKMMAERKTKGSIINISSMSGLDKPAKGACGYGASKAAVNFMAKNLVGELSPHGIRINSIAPGWVRTKMTEEVIKKYENVMLENIPLGFIAAPEHLDGALLFLASNKASGYVTGSTILADGGTSWGGI